jgi:hypothetical protein
MAQRSDDTSYFVHVASGSFSMRTNIVGTSCVWVRGAAAPGSQVRLGVEVLHDHAPCRPGAAPSW